MPDNVFQRIAAATAAGRVEELAAIAMELASSVASLESLRVADEARKAGQAARKRRQRNSVSRDVTGQAETGSDVAAQPETSPSSPQVSLINPSFPPPSPLPAEPRVIQRLPGSPKSAGVDAVVAHYVARFPKRRPGEKDRKLIARHLATYSPAELCEAIDGNADDDWAQKAGKHELTWVLRDNGQIDTYRAKGEQPGVKIVDGWFADAAS